MRLTEKTKLHLTILGMTTVLLGLSAFFQAGAVQAASPAPVTLVSIAVTPANPSIPLGIMEQFTATGTYSDGSMQNLTDMVTWSSSATTVATISNAGGSQGLATSVGTGTTTITAALDSISGSTGLTVTPPILVSIAVTPVNPSIPLGKTEQFTATGTYTNGTTRNLTTKTKWNSSAINVATISNTKGSQGLATTKSVGTTTITATVGSISGSTILTVTPPVLVSISVTPANASIILGKTQQFTATGTYTNATTQNLTKKVNWTSSLTTVATISNSIGTQGLATSTGLGATTIQATLGSVSNLTALSVTPPPPTLVSITVTPAAPSIVVGTKLQFSATGTYSDHSTKNLTNSVLWGSSNIKVATVSNSKGSQGQALGIMPGTATITARSGSVSGPTILTVGSQTLIGIVVSPAFASIAAGAQLQFTATGQFSNGIYQDITLSVQWSSSNASVANVVANTGLASALAPGSTGISATLGPATGGTTLTVTGPTLESMSVTPINLEIPLGFSLQFVATGTFSDGSMQVLTNSVAWNSSDTSVATISNSSGMQGQAVGESAGSTTISTTDGAVTGTTTLTVGELQTLDVSASDYIIPESTSEQFTATGTFADGNSDDLTQFAFWSCDSGVATISNSAPTKGLATASSDTTGLCNIIAQIGSVKGSAQLTVTTASLVSLAVTPLNASITLGKSEQFTATGTYSDGSSYDLTDNVAWDSTVKNIAVTNDSGVASSSGMLGTTTITATALGLTGSATLTVTLPSDVGTYTYIGNPYDICDGNVFLPPCTQYQVTASITLPLPLPANSEIYFSCPPCFGPFSFTDGIQTLNPSNAEASGIIYTDPNGKIFDWGITAPATVGGCLPLGTGGWFGQEAIQSSGPSGAPEPEDYSTALYFGSDYTCRSGLDSHGWIFSSPGNWQYPADPHPQGRRSAKARSR